MSYRARAYGFDVSFFPSTDEASAEPEPEFVGPLTPDATSPQPAGASTTVRPTTVPLPTDPGVALASLFGASSLPWLIGGAVVAIGLLVVVGKKHR